MGVSTSASTGARGAIHVGQEEVYGVVAEPTHLIEFTSESLSAEEESLESEAIRDSRGRHHIIRGTLDVQGDINFEQNTSGLAILYKNALGDYLKIPKVDGGIHARVERDGQVVVETDTAGEAHFVIPFTKDHTGGFTTEAGEMLIVSTTRNSLDNLVALDNAGAGYAYADYTHGCETYVLDVDASGDAVEVSVAWVRDEEGVLVAPAFCASGGVAKMGHSRKEYKYFASDEGNAVDGATLSLDPVQTPPGTAALHPAEGDYVIGMAGVVRIGTLDKADPDDVIYAGNFEAYLAKAGNWFYQYVGEEEVFTHHIERGKRLPVGLTVEIDRDAAIFIYTGVRVNSVSASFESGEIATGTFSLLGKVEHAMATLLEDVLPNARTIKVNKIQAFPNMGDGGGSQPAFDPNEPSAKITIREETDIYFQWIEKTPQGDYILGGIPTFATDIVGAPVAGYEKNAVEQFHPKGSNVDSRSSIKADEIVKGIDTPLTSFEITVFMDGYFEEVLNASLTLNNNLDTDKFFLGDRFRAFAVEGRAEIEGSLGMEFDDGKHYVKFLNGDYFALEIKCINEDEDGMIGGTGIPSQAYFFMPRCKFSGNTPNIEGMEIINHDMPFMATVDDKHNTTDLIVILVNAEGRDAEI